MNLELAGVAEKLVYEFPELPVMDVIAVLCGCADQCDTAGPFFIEQAARACLAARQQAVVRGDGESLPPVPVVNIPEQARSPREETEAEPRPATRTESASATVRAAAAPA